MLVVAGNVVPGNLVSTSKVLVSQSTDAIAAYVPSSSKVQKELAALEANEVSTLLKKATFDLQNGNVKSRDQKPATCN